MGILLLNIAFCDIKYNRISIVRIRRHKMKELEEEIVKFAKDRDWLQFNTPENLAKSISIEAGELLECFQWNNNYNKDELKYEIADVMNYCILLCHQIGVDPKQIVLEKMKISERKYPIEKSKGVSTKYNKL
jgi:dCTP diphosphatase